MSAQQFIPQGMQEQQEIIQPKKLTAIFEQPTAYQPKIAAHTHIDLEMEIASIEKDIENLKNLFTVHTVLLNTLGSDKWEIRKPPLHVSIEQRGVSEFVACLYDINIYGYGDTIPETLDDLKEAMVNQFEFLSEQESSIKLGDMPKKQFNFLKEIMVEKHARSKRHRKNIG
jgi:predicted RNase H-like HicB family nuclease